MITPTAADVAALMQAALPALGPWQVSRAHHPGCPRVLPLGACPGGSTDAAPVVLAAGLTRGEGWWLCEYGWDHDDPEPLDFTAPAAQVRRVLEARAARIHAAAVEAQALSRRAAP